MLKGQSIVAVIPARGGSQRIPKKNIADIDGKPLLAHTIDIARQLPEIDAILVSSDDSATLTIAAQYGAEPVRRPEALALAHVKDEPVLLHALETLEAQNRSYDYVVMLQATCPLRRLETVSRVIAHAISGDFDVVATVVENRENFRTLRNGVWAPVVANAPRRQQEREPFYAETGVCYMINAQKLKETKLIFAGRKEDFIIVDPIEGIDINIPIDLEFVRFLKSKGY